jgi:hypothetical protein
MDFVSVSGDQICPELQVEFARKLSGLSVVVFLVFGAYGAPKSLNVIHRVRRDALTIHNFAYSGEDEKTEAALKSLKRLVDVTGIEPVTPCLQSRCSPS